MENRFHHSNYTKLFCNQAHSKYDIFLRTLDSLKNQTFSENLTHKKDLLATHKTDRQATSLFHHNLILLVKRHLYFLQPYFIVKIRNKNLPLERSGQMEARRSEFFFRTWTEASLMAKFSPSTSPTKTVHP